MEELKPTPANSTPLTPLIYLERAAIAYADSPSIVYNDTVYTWSQTHRRCLSLASSLAASGIVPGQVVSVVSPNTPAMYELQFAVPMSGAVLNNISTRLDARTISLQLSHSRSTLVFVDSFSSSVVHEAVRLIPESATRSRLVLIEDDNGTPSTEVAGCHFFSTYEDFIQKGDPEFKWVRPRSEWDPMTINYTSGTTSSPKGVVHCHRGLFLMSLSIALDWGLPKRPVYLWTLPIFHINGWSYVWSLAAVGGTSVCLRSYDAAKVIELIKRNGVTHMCGAPVVLNMLASSPNCEPLESPVEILVGGAPPPAPVLSRAEQMGFLVSHGYGLTETAGPVMSCAWKPQWDPLPLEERAQLKSRQGVQIAGFADADVVDPISGESAKRDGTTIGEVVLRGGSVMLGYLEDPVETAKCMKRDGWFYTGDVGVVHPDGYLEIKDRSKDVIICGGENVSSVEVEAVIYANPAVREVVVVARADEFWGELPCAFVSLKEGGKHVTERELIGFCKERLPHFMVPKTVVFKSELPKTATGKIQKFAIRELAKNMGPSRIWYRPFPRQPKASFCPLSCSRQKSAFAHLWQPQVMTITRSHSTLLSFRPTPAWL